MATYTPPLRDLAFVLHDVLAVQDSAIPGYADLDRDFTAPCSRKPARSPPRCWRR